MPDQSWDGLTIPQTNLWYFTSATVSLNTYANYSTVTWSNDGARKSVAVHEFGHIFGLDENYNSRTIMNPYTWGTNSRYGSYNLTTPQLDGIPLSTFEVEVVESIYGCENEDSFSIRMTGAQVDNKKIEIIDDPLLEKGQEFLVFAAKNDNGTYRILSGPQGRLEYKDGKLNSLQFVNENVRDNNKVMTLNIQNEDAKTVIERIKGVKLPQQ